jgi:hypothetical protein
MRKTVAAILIPGFLAASMGAAHAENSVSCVYMILRIYHAQMEACRVPLKATNEAGYQRVNTMLQTFIRENAKQNPDAILASVENKVKLAVKNPGCKAPEFPQVVSAMESFTSSFGESELRENLKRKRDPQAGTCG